MSISIVNCFERELDRFCETFCSIYCIFAEVLRVYLKTNFGINFTEGILMFIRLVSSKKSFLQVLSKAHG